MFRSLARLARGKTSVTVPIGHVQKLGERFVFSPDFSRTHRPFKTRTLALNSKSDSILFIQT